MNKNTIAIALVAAVASANNGNGNAYGKDPDFMDWAAKHNKSFKDKKDMDKREANFNASYWKVQELRQRHPKTRFELNIFSDLDEEEKDALLGLDEQKLREGRNLQAEPAQGRHLQEGQDLSIDWLATDHLGPVKNQGQCGSCWAFNSSSVLEAVKSIKDTETTGSYVAPKRLSEQEAVDCSDSFGNNGCNGGWPSNYWNYAKINGALSYADYPYIAADQACNLPVDAQPETFVQDWSWVSQNDQAIAQALQAGPLSVAVHVQGDAWWYYAGGELDPATCADSGVNHALVLVGYESGIGGFEPGEDVWVPPTEEYCRASRRRERKRGRCNGGVAILSEDTTQCCVPGEEGYFEEGDPVPIPAGDPVWVFQNSWGLNWGVEGMIRIPVEVGSGTGHCQVQQYAQSVLAV